MKLMQIVLCAVMFGQPFVSTAVADVIGHYTFWNTYYRQTSPAQPQSPVAWEFYCGVDFSNPLDVESVVLTHPGPGSPTLLAQTPGSARLSRFFGSATERDAAFPAGDYSFAISGGLLDGHTGSLSVDGYYFPTGVPYFAGSTYLGLQSVDPALGYSGTVSSFTPLPWASTSEIAVSIYAQSGALIFFQFVDPGTLGFTIPPKLLEYETEYRVEAVFLSNRFANQTGFNGLGRVSFVHRTVSTLYTIRAECRGDANLGGVVTFDDITAVLSSLGAECGQR